MNSETRMPDAASARHGVARCARSDPATFKPPSVVTSWRDSGTRQQSCGLTSLRDADHLVGHRHFEIHAGLQRLAHHRDVAILDVPAILAQMQRDAVGAGLLGEKRRVQRIRIAGAARLAQRRHVINVHAQRDAAVELARSRTFLAAV